MENREIKALVDTIYCGEADVMYRGRHFFINGARYVDNEHELHLDVYEIDDTRDCIVATPFSTCQKTADKCLRAFLAARIWDGRDFWEAAPEMEWV